MSLVLNASRLRQVSLSAAVVILVYAVKAYRDFEQQRAASHGPHWGGQVDADSGSQGSGVEAGGDGSAAAQAAHSWRVGGAIRLKKSKQRASAAASRVSPSSQYDHSTCVCVCVCVCVF